MFTVQAMLAFREGEMIHHALRYYPSVADVTIVMLDNHDKETEDIVQFYAKMWPDKYRVFYSSTPKYTEAEENEPGRMNKLFKEREGEIRNELLGHVHDLNKERPIDILLWGDADEIFTKDFPRHIERLKHSGRGALLCSHIQMIGDFHTFHNRKFYSHCKAFIYRPDLTTIPMQGQCFIQPYRKYRDNIRAEHVVIHLADYDKEFMKKRAQYKKRPFANDVFVWRTEKDVRDMTSDEYKKIVKEQKPLMTMNEYLYA